MAEAKEIFLAALGRQDTAERAAFLAEACEGDAALCQRVEALLQAHDEADSLLEKPAAGLSPTVAQAPDSAQPGTMIGPYKLMEKIGEGGFGLVFVAEQRLPVRRQVALKIIKPGMDTREVIGRFEAERQALALMDHPHIARVFDAGSTENGRPYFIMELVRGVPITEYCDQHQLTPRERLALFVAVCQAVQHAHQKGVIHRDIKPSNVLVTLHDGRPFPKVIDFGIAKAINQQLTQRTLYTRFSQMIGTPLYMSPEQAEMTTQDVDTRSDIYSLGVLLYELLTGTTPFDQRRLSQAAFDELRRIIREEEPPKPSQRLSTSGTLASVAAQRRMPPARLSRLVRGELDWIVMKALEKDRNRRYDTAAGFARDVERYLQDEPVEASPPSPAYRLRKIIRKYGVVLGTAAALAAILLAAAAVSTWQAVRATRAEGAALNQKFKAEMALTVAQEAKTAADQARAAEERSRKAAQTNAIRIEADRYRQEAFRGDFLSDLNEWDGATIKQRWDMSGAIGYKGRDGAAALKLARLVAEIPNFASAWREALTLNVLEYGQQLAPLLPAPEVNGFPLKNPKLSGDHRMLVARSSDGQLQVYSYPELRHRASLSMEGQGIGPFDVQGANLVWAMSADKSRVQLWSLDSLAPLGGAITSLRPIERLFISTDGLRCVTISKDEKPHKEPQGGEIPEFYHFQAAIWDTVAGRKRAEIPDLASLTEHVFFGNSPMALSPDGRWLVAVADSHGELTVWSTSEGRLEGRHAFDPNSGKYNLKFSPSGAFLAVGSWGGLSWWRTANWKMIEPICESSASIDESSLQFLSEDVVWWSGASWVKGPDRFSARRGEPHVRPYGILQVNQDLLLATDGNVYRQGSYEPAPKLAREKFPREAARFAFGGRYLALESGLFDLATESIVSRAPREQRTVVQADGLAWTDLQVGGRKSDALIGCAPYPERPNELDPRTIELWLQVVLRGELDATDHFAAWDEATWESRRQELAGRRVRLGRFDFPGPMVEDRRYWLRTEARETAYGNDYRVAERAMELTTRLVREEPTWRSHDMRAAACWKNRSSQPELLRESLGERLEAARLGGAAYWQEAVIPDLTDEVFEKDLTADDFEMVLRFSAERQSQIGPRDDDRVARSMARYRLGQYREAIDELEPPEEAEARQNMIRTLCLLAAGDKAGAQAVYRAARRGFDECQESGAWHLKRELYPLLPELAAPE